MPLTIKNAKVLVTKWHRHHKTPTGGLFAVGCGDGLDYCGVAIIGRPVARRLQDGWTAEVTRLATDGTKNSCSMLYGAAWRAARALGYLRLYTYTLVSEPGTSLRAAGYKLVGHVKGRSWSVPSRPRTDKHPTCDKQRWLRAAVGASE